MLMTSIRLGMEMRKRCRYVRAARRNRRCFVVVTLAAAPPELLVSSVTHFDENKRIVRPHDQVDFSTVAAKIVADEVKTG